MGARADGPRAATRPVLAEGRVRQPGGSAAARRACARARERVPGAHGRAERPGRQRRGPAPQGRRVAGDRPGMAAPHRGCAARGPHRGGPADPRRDEAGDPAPRAADPVRAVLPPSPTRDDAARAGAGQQEPLARSRHEIVVLDGVSLEVEAGEFVAIFGRPAHGQDDAPAHRGRHRRARRRARSRSPGAELRVHVGCQARGAGVASRARRCGGPAPVAGAWKMLDTWPSPLLGSGITRATPDRRATRAGPRDVGDQRSRAAMLHELSDAERTRVTFAQAHRAQTAPAARRRPDRDARPEERNARPREPPARRSREERIAVLDQRDRRERCRRDQPPARARRQRRAARGDSRASAPVVPLPTRTQARAGDARVCARSSSTYGAGRRARPRRRPASRSPSSAVSSSRSTARAAPARRRCCSCRGGDPAARQRRACASTGATSRA